ncbi:right-handed parallel beta-helix repeat-containing protein [Candidatus Sumerlaeota bacterium]|nr:right-handed parallel beta-helix repeat-containing protein [Candidatus Sumerlaeota bacterium]
MIPISRSSRLRLLILGNALGVILLFGWCNNTSAAFEYENVLQAIQEFYPVQTMDDEYHSSQDAKKHLFGISASVPVLHFLVGAGVEIFIDLDDYFRLTPEGQDDWVTFYLIGKAGAGPSVLPVYPIVMWYPKPGGLEPDDPDFYASVTASTLTAGYSIETFKWYPLNGSARIQEINVKGIDFNISAQLDSTKIPLVKCEIRRQMLDAWLAQVTLQVPGTALLNGQILAYEMANNAFTMDKIIGAALNPVQYPATPSDGAPSASSSPDATIHRLSFSYELSALPGRPVNVVSSLRNNGSTQATCSVGYYLDSISPISMIHEELGVIVPAEGQSADIAFYWNTDQVGIGWHKIIVDIRNVIPEDANLNNNVSPWPYLQCANPLARIISIVPSPGIQAQDTITFAGFGQDVDDYGTLPQIRTYRWFASPGKTNGTTVIYDGPNSAFTIPASDLKVGTHKISLYVQDNDGPNDTPGEWSDVATATLTVLPPQTGQPDYRVNQLSMIGGTSGLHGGDPLSVTINTSNVGSVPGGSDSQTRVYLRTRQGDDPRPLGTAVSAVSVGNLSGGAAQVSTFGAVYPSVAPGVYYLAACADANNQIGEANETNNWTYYPAALTFGGGTPPGGFGNLTLNSPAENSHSPIKTGDPIFVDLSWDFSSASDFPDVEGVAFHFRFQQGGYSWSTTWRPYETRTGRNTFRIASPAAAADGDYGLNVEVENLGDSTMVLAKTWSNTVNLSPSHSGATLPQPSAPTASLVWAGRNNVHLEWDYGAYGQSEFWFERSQNGGPFGRVHWLDCHGQAVKVNDETVDPETTYAYRFQARINDSIVSEFSDSVSIAVPPQFPIPPGALVYPDNFPGMSIYEAMASAKSQGRSEMYLRAGDWSPSGPFGFPGDFALIGGGSGTTTIRSGIIMGLNGGGHMRLAGVRLLNPGAHQIGLELLQVGSGVTLEDVTLDGFPTGVKVDRTPLEADGFECKAASSRSLWITNNGYASVHVKNGYIHNNPGNGIEVSWTNADLLIEDTLISQNSGRGAEIVASQGTYEFNRCVFSHNGTYGLHGNCPGIVVRNCVAYANTGAGIYLEGGNTCRNCIAFSNGAEGITGGPWYSLAFGNTGGDIYPNEYQYQVGNNIIADPRFVSPASGDLHLLSDSPAIDSGDPSDAYDLEPEPNGNRINMGNYGNTPSATTSLGAAPAPPTLVQVESLPGCSIRVRWWDASDNEDGFRVEREKDGETGFQAIREVLSDSPVSSGTLEMTDEEILPETLYWYRVSSFNSHGLGLSNTVSTMTLEAPLGNQPPSPPVNIYPFFAQDGVPGTTILVASAFSDPDPGDTLTKSRFQIASNGGNFATPVWDSGSATAGKTYCSVSVSAGLQASQYYRWRCRYRDNKGAWGSWSNETVFRVEEAPPEPPIRVKNISRAGYTTDTLEVGNLLYVDRTYVFQSPIPPEYEGQTYIRTANADKNATDGDFLSFDIDRAATVVVTRDARFTTRPSWMNGWNAVSGTLSTNDSSPSRNLYARDYPAGRVTLGSNRDVGMQSGLSMYNVIVVPDVRTAAKDWILYE